MPELPEVETVRRSLEREIVGRRIVRVEVRKRRLRRPVGLPAEIVGSEIVGLGRRGKYLLFRTDRGWLVVHLGMSGTVRLLPHPEPPGLHDHIDLLLSGDLLLRYRDPRRFGLWLWSVEETPPPLRTLGPEPFELDGDKLYRSVQNRRRTIKQLLLDGRLVAGIGNIYANEALFRARLDPRLEGRCLTREACRRLVSSIREVLEEAIELGGTTLKDFRNGRGQPGKFQLALKVYGREGERCFRCQAAIRKMVLAGRSTYFCPRCQR